MATPRQARRYYEFGPFRLDALNRLLLRDGEIVPLSPVIVETLRILVENRGRGLTKEELLSSVWPDTFVEESNLTHNISVLRKTLGEGPGEQRFIQTIPRRGYRFVGAVSEMGDAACSQLTVLPRRPPLARFVWALSLVALAGAAAGTYFWLRPSRMAAPGNVTFVQLTDQPGQELYPSLTPDGHSFVYASRASGNWDIYMQRVGGKTPVNLTKDSTFDDTQPTFSPDGAHVAFRSERDGGGIFVMGATGESVRRITDAGYDPAWSPDGKHVVCATATFRRPDYRPYLGSLFAVDVVSGEKRPLAESAGDAVQPRWSPGGQRIAYWGLHGAYRDIATVSSRGGDFVQVTRDAALDWNPTWSPDGKYLYFSSDRGGSMNLWRVAVVEESGKVVGPPEPVTTPSPFSGYISFSADGRRLAYAHQVHTVNLERLAFDPVTEMSGGQPVAVTQGLKILRSPIPSSDGMWLTFSSGGAREDIFVMRADGTGSRQLTDDPHRDRVPVWSPDDKRIAFCSTRTGKYEIWIINADGSGLQQLTYAPGTQLVSPVWSPDGARLACSGLGGDAMIIETDKRWTDQRPESLPPLGRQNVNFAPRSWSPDGKRLAGDLRHPHGASSGLVVYSLVDKKYKQLTNFGCFPKWLGDGRRLVFYDESKIYLLDTRSGRVREILSIAPHSLEHGPHLAISRDNRWIYFSLAINEADIWLMNVESGDPDVRNPLIR